MRHGFKAQAEKRSLAARQLLGAGILAPFDPWIYASCLNAFILDLNALGLDDGTIRQLTVLDADSWSAMTIKENYSLGIVLNPSHALTRQRADLMHELAHLELNHSPARVDVSKTGLLLLSDYSEEQEQEADWHAAAYLLPRDGIYQLRAKGKSALEIAQQYGVSKALCDWRLRMTGVEIQMRRAAGQ